MAFPTWPPPNGGQPFSGTELGPITNPFPYGTTQTANISISNPAPPSNGTRYPQSQGIALNGQNQAPPSGWPTWPTIKFNVLPDKANPLVSQLP